MTNGHVQQLKNRYMRKSFIRFVEDYAENGYPVPFDQSFVINGMKIRVQAERVDEAKPPGKSAEIMNDRSVDA